MVRFFKGPKSQIPESVFVPMKKAKNCFLVSPFGLCRPSRPKDSISQQNPSEQTPSQWGSNLLMTSQY